MAVTVADELLYKFKADATQLFATFKQIESGMGGLKKTNPFTNVKQQMSEADRYYGVFNDTVGATTKKMAILKSGIETLTKSGLDKNAGAVKALKKEYDALAQSGSLGDKLTRGLDALTGGKISQAQNVLQGMGIDLAKIGPAAAIAGAAIVAIGVAWNKALLPGIQFNMMLEQQETGFRVMLGSAEKAAQTMGDLKKLALTTGIGFAEGATATKQLIAYGFAQDEIVKSMKMLKTVASATGTTVGDLTYVYGTLRAQGRAYTRDLMQFGMRGIPIFEYLAQTMGVSVKEIRKLAEAGDIGFPEVEKAFQAMTGEGGRFNNMLEEMMKTSTGLAQLIKVNWDLATSEMAKPLDGGIKQFLELTLNLIKGVTPLLQLIGKLLSPILMAFNSIYSIVILVFQAIGFIAEAINKLFDALGGMITYMDKVSVSIGLTRGQAELLRAAIGLVLALMVGMINPIAGIGIALVSLQGPLGWLVKQAQKLLDKFRGIKEITEFKIPPIHVPVVIDMKDEAAKKQLTEMVKQFKFESKMKGESSWMPTPEQLGKIQAAMEMANTKGFSYSWEEIVNLVQKEADTSMSQAIYDGLMSAADDSAKDFWSRFKRLGALENIGEMADFYETGAKAAAAYVKGWDVAIAGERSMGELLSLSKEDVTSNVSAIAQDAYDVLYKKIKQMRGEMILDPSVATGAYMDLYEALIAKAQEYYKLIEDKGKKSASDIAEYMKFRADAMNKESEFLRGILTSYTGMTDQLGYENEYLKRQIASIEYAAELQKQALVNEGKLSDKQLISRFAIIDAMTLQAEKQAKLNEGIRLYNQALMGSEKYWEELKSKMGYTAESIGKTNSPQGKFSGYANYASQAAVAATEGTDMGALIAGGAGAAATGGILLLIEELVKVIAQMEEFSQTLNFIATIGKGFAYALQIADKAFRPLNTVLMMLGQLIGTIIGPILQMLGEYWSDMAKILAPIIDWLMRLFNVIMPLVILLWKLANPIIILFDILAEMIGMGDDELELRRQQIEDMKELYDKQIKSLQDLYNVGAISGQEYERRLAELKAGMSTVEENGGGGGMAQISAAINALMEFITTYIYPVVQVIAEAIGGILQSVGGIFTTLVSTIGNILKSLFDILGPLFVQMMPLFKIIGDTIAWLIGTLIPILDAINFVLTLIGGVINTFVNIVGLIVAIFSGNGEAVAYMKSLVQASIDQLGVSLKAAWDTLVGSVKSWLLQLINIFIDIADWIWAPFTDNFAPVTSFDVGTDKVPKDMLANVHEGEMIIPATFAEAIRKGDVNLGSSSAGKNTTINNYVVVEGSVISERDFYRTVGSELTKLSRQGHL